jgi:phosphatidylethanolamine-binding protein (PEBP) family uncharacterized protein
VKLRNLSLLSLSISTLALALAGCGSSGSGPSAATKPAIPFGSPALIANGRVIPAHYKCDSRFVWLPLRWGAVPAGTQELALYMVRFGFPKLASNQTAKAEIKATAIVVGLKPTLHGLSRGKYPHGALVGVHAPNNPAASICPPKGAAQNLLFRIYALPHKLGVSKSSKGADLVSRLSSEASEAGTFIAAYKPA